MYVLEGCRIVPTGCGQHGRKGKNDKDVNEGVDLSRSTSTLRPNRKGKSVGNGSLVYHKKFTLVGLIGECRPGGWEGKVGDASRPLQEHFSIECTAKKDVTYCARVPNFPTSLHLSSRS